MRARATVLAEIYRPLYLNAAPILYVSRRTAELIKYAANAFLATKITFINEIADLCEQRRRRRAGCGARHGPRQPHRRRNFCMPGPGFGGSCLPKDATALLKTAHDHGAQLRIVETVAAVNEQRKRAMARKVVAALDGSMRGKTIAVLGLTFKPNTDDTRDSPSIPLITALHDLGAKVRGYDPAGMEQAKPQLPDVIYCSSAYEAAEGADAVVIATEWEQFRALDLDRLRRAHGAAGDRRSAQHLSRRRNEAGELPLLRGRAARCRAICGARHAEAPQSGRHEIKNGRARRRAVAGRGKRSGSGAASRTRRGAISFAAGETTVR